MCSFKSVIMCIRIWFTKYITISGLLEPQVLIEGVLFRARYLGSTQLVCEGQPTKSTRMMQAEEAVSRIKVIIYFIIVKLYLWFIKLPLVRSYLLFSDNRHW